MSEYIAKASIEPRDYRVVFLIQKGQPPACDWPSDLSVLYFSIDTCEKSTVPFVVTK